MKNIYKCIAAALLLFSIFVFLWKIHDLNYYIKKKHYENNSLNVNGNIIRDSNAIAESLRKDSIVNVATYIIEKNKTENPLTSAEITKLIVRNNSKFLYPPGTIYRMDSKGFLEDISNGKKYEVRLNGTNVIVNPK